MRSVPCDYKLVFLTAEQLLLVLVLSRFGQPIELGVEFDGVVAAFVWDGFPVIHAVDGLLVVLTDKLLGIATENENKIPITFLFERDGARTYILRPTDFNEFRVTSIPNESGNPKSDDFAGRDTPQSIPSVLVSVLLQ